MKSWTQASMVCALKKNEDFLDRSYEKLAQKRLKSMEEKWQDVTTRKSPQNPKEMD